MPNFSFASFSSRSEQTMPQDFFEPNFEATRKDPDPKKKPNYYYLFQPWPTQIGSRATFLKNRHFKGQNLDFF
jgi:hypothetical protein